MKTYKLNLTFSFEVTTDGEAGKIWQIWHEMIELSDDFSCAVVREVGTTEGIERINGSLADCSINEVKE